MNIDYTIDLLVALEHKTHDEEYKLALQDAIRRLRREKENA